MSTAPYVFISYARADSQAVDRIVEGLEKSGIRTWRDISEIKPGMEWATAIESAAKQASAYVYFASVNSSASAYMERELLYAVSRSSSNITIVPVIIDDSGPRAVPLFLKQYQWVDFRQNFDAALQSLVDALSVSIPRADSAKPKDKVSKGYAFISYSVDDREFLGTLKEFLAVHDYGYWDFHENKRNYEMQFHLELEEIIKGAEVMLCIMSPSWKRSKWTPREFLYAEEIGKPVFLLRAKKLEPTLLVAGLSYIDFAEDPSTGYQELNRELISRGF